MNRIAIVGTTGAGKTTLGERLSALLDIPFIDLDVLGWEANWTQPPPEVMNARVSVELSGDRWITAGNYSRVRPIVWGMADTLIWLDYPLRVIFSRLFRRTVRRVVGREELWGGNRESFREQFMSRDSLFYDAATTHNRRRAEFPVDLAKPAYAHLPLLRFRKPEETERWLARIDRVAADAAQ